MHTHVLCFVSFSTSSASVQSLTALASLFSLSTSFICDPQLSLTRYMYLNPFLVQQLDAYAYASSYDQLFKLSVRSRRPLAYTLLVLHGLASDCAERALPGPVHCTIRLSSYPTQSFTSHVSNIESSDIDDPSRTVRNVISRLPLLIAP